MDNLDSIAYILLDFLCYIANLFISLSIHQSIIHFDAFQSKYQISVSLPLNTKACSV